MISKVNKYFIKGSRKSQINLSASQENLRRKYEKKYIAPMLFNHTDILMEQQLYGRKCYVGGSTPNNIDSATYVHELTRFVAPKHIILGNLSPTDGKVKFRVSTKYMPTPTTSSPEKLFCKSILSQYIQRQFDKNQHFSYDHDKKCFFIIDKTDRRITTNDYLTAAYQSVFDPNCKLSYGLPSDLLVFEDIVLSHTLDQLQTIFYSSINRIKEQYPTQYAYQASIVDDLLRQNALQQEPTLYSKQKLFTTALLRRFARITDKVLLITHNCHTKSIGQEVHKVSIEPETIYPKRKLREIEQNDFREQNIGNPIKVCNLNVFEKQNLEEELCQGQNVFSHSIFSPLFANLSIQTIHSLYRKAKAKYAQSFFDTQAFFMKNIEKHRYPIEKSMTLTQQFQLLEQRKTYFPYSYIPEDYVTIKNDRDSMVQLKDKMIQLLIKQGNEEDIQLIKDHFSGKFTKQSIILYSKLIGMASIQMPKKIKLPIYHFEGFRSFYKQYLRDFIMKKNQPKQEDQFKKFKLTKEQQEAIEDAKIFNDPDEVQLFLQGKKGKLIKKIDLYENEEDKTLEVEADPKEVEEFMEIIKQKNNSREY